MSSWWRQSRIQRNVRTFQISSHHRPSEPCTRNALHKRTSGASILGRNGDERQRPSHVRPFLYYKQLQESFAAPRVLLITGYTFGEFSFRIRGHSDSATTDHGQEQVSREGSLDAKRLVRTDSTLSPSLHRCLLLCLKGMWKTVGWALLQALADFANQ